MKIFAATIAFLAVVSIGLPVRADAVADLLAALAGPVAVPVATTTASIAATTTTTAVQSAAPARGSCMFGYHEASGQCVSDIFPAMSIAAVAATSTSSGGISAVGATTSATELMEIDALMAEIAHLKEVLVSLANNGSTVPAANVATLNGTPFIRNLSFGSKGDDVKALQEFLIGIGILPEGDDTGFYGQATESAVQQYQIRNEITAIGSQASGFGVVGPKTRAAILAGDNAPALTEPANTSDDTPIATSTTDVATSTPPATPSTTSNTEPPPVTYTPATTTMSTAPSEPTPTTAPFIPPPVETDTLPPPPTDVPSTSGDPAASTSTTDVPPPPTS